MKKMYCILNALLVFCFSLYSQQLEWYQTYDTPGSGSEILFDVADDGDNNIYLCGAFEGLDRRYDFTILKYSRLGELIFEARDSVNNGSFNAARSVVINNNGDIYVSGEMRDSSCLRKISSEGHILWTKYFSSRNFYFDKNPVMINKKGEVITGYALDKGEYKFSGHIQKLSSSGDTIWSWAIEDDSLDYYIDYLAIDDENNIYASVSAGRWYSDYYASSLVLVKLTDSGTLAWKKYLDLTSASQFLLDNKNNIITLIDALSHYVVKADNYGNLVWEDYFYGFLMNTTADYNNNIISAYLAYMDTSLAFSIRKLSEAGSFLWEAKLPVEAGWNGYPIALQVDRANNIYISGMTSLSDTTGVCNIAKLKSSGEILWHYKKEIPGKYFSKQSMFIDVNDDIYIAGDSDGPTQWDLNFLYLFKVNTDSISDGISETATPVFYGISQNYPNPFNSQSSFMYSLPEAGRVIIKIYDVLGNEIQTLVNEDKPAGNYIQTITGGDLASGVYFYHMTSGTFQGIKKYILLR